MKRILNKTTMAIILALTMLFAVVGGLLLSRSVKTASAADARTTVTISSDAQSYFPGLEFTLTVTVSSERTDNFFSLDFDIGPIASDGISFEADKAEKLTFSNFKTDSRYTAARLNTSNGTYIVSENLGYYEGQGGYAAFGNMHIGAYYGSGAKIVGADFVFTVDVKIADDVEEGTAFKIDMPSIPLTAVKYNTAGKTTDDPTGGAGTDAGLLKIEPLEFEVKKPSDNAALKSVKAGQEEPLSDVNFSEGAGGKMEGSITITDPSEDLLLEIEAEEAGSTVTVQPGNVTKGEDGKYHIDVSDIDDANGKITIEVTAEDGKTKKTYEIDVTVVGAMLVSLNVTSTAGTSGVNAKLNEVFDSALTAYTVNVPNDSKSATITATVSTGHSESSVMDLALTGSCQTNNGSTADSGVAFTVTDIATDDTVKLTLHATKDSTNSTKEYTITFTLVDVNANLEKIEVKGQTKNTIFTSSSKKATEENVDYYYMIIGETNAASKITLKAESTDPGVKINLDGTLYTSTRENVTEGSHTITVIAAAGNTKDYKFYLKNYEPLTLKAGVDADFIFEETVEQGARKFNYRRSYEEKSMTHGISDIEFDRFVIGNIADYTNVYEFLGNFETATQSKIKLYTNKNELVYSLGADVADHDDLNDADEYAVGTGWYIEYVVNGKVEETIYISVIGDIDGDGVHGSGDISALSRAIRGLAALSNVEYRLAGYLVNTGSSLAGDLATISSFIKSEATADEFFS